MELRRLRYFLAVVETANVTRAAERCFVTQSTLSAQIARLETEVGSRLFVRTPRGVRLTHAGEVLCLSARRILADVDEAESELAALRGVVRGRVRLGVIQGLPRRIDLVDLIADFHAHHPDVELQVRTGASADLVTDAADGALDLAVVALPSSDMPAHLKYAGLVDDPLVAVLAGAVADPLEPIDVAGLTQLGPFIHYRRRSGLRRSVDAAIERAGAVVDPRFELDQISDMVRLAARGVGVTIVPASALGPAGAAGTGADGPVGLRLADPEAVHAVGLVATQDTSPATRALIRSLRDRRAGCHHLRR